MDLHTKGGRIGCFRSLAGLSEEELGARVGLEQRSISAIEHNRHSPDEQTIALIAEQLCLRAEFVETGKGSSLSAPVVAYPYVTIRREQEIRKARKGIFKCLEHCLLSDPFLVCVASIERRTILLAVWKAYNVPKAAPAFVLYSPGPSKDSAICMIESQRYTIVDTRTENRDDVFEIGLPLIQEYLHSLDKITGLSDLLEIDVAKATKIIMEGRAARRKLEWSGAEAVKRTYTAHILDIMGSNISIGDLESYIDSVAHKTDGKTEP
jgi:transcriptional regulator with XRE-family HTH domain